MGSDRAEPNDYIGTVKLLPGSVGLLTLLVRALHRAPQVRCEFSGIRASAGFVYARLQIER